VQITCYFFTSKKENMKYFIILLAFFIGQETLMGQTSRMNNISAARTYTSQNLSETVIPLLQEAERQFKRLDYEECLNTLDYAVAQNPNSAAALSLRARIKRIVGMETESEMDLRNANQINPFAANLYGYYGNLGVLEVLYIDPKIEEQEDNLLDLDLAVDEYPKDESIRMRRGNQRLLRGMHLQAIDDYTKAIQLNTNYGESYYNRGITFLMIFDEVSGCADLDKSIELGYVGGQKIKKYFCP